MIKPVLVLLLALTVLAGCATTPSLPASPRADVLILAPQGVNPDIDTVGFNQLVRNVTQAFATALSGRLKDRNLSVISILDQNPKFDAGQKLAVYATRHSSKTAIVVTVETESAAADDRILLRAQHVDQTFIIDGGRVTGVRPISTVEKSYLLRSSVTGDSTASMSDLADDFVAFLKAKHRL